VIPIAVSPGKVEDRFETRIHNAQSDYFDLCKHSIPRKDPEIHASYLKRPKGYPVDSKTASVYSTRGLLHNFSPQEQTPCLKGTRLTSE
jgi:hypothetical protein